MPRHTQTMLEAIKANDEDTVAMLWRAEQIGEDFDNEGRLTSGLSGEEILLGILVPSPDIEERSRQVAQSIIHNTKSPLKRQIPSRKDSSIPGREFEPGEKCGKGHLRTDENTSWFWHPINGGQIKRPHCNDCRAARKQTPEQKERKSQLAKESYARQMKQKDEYRMASWTPENWRWAKLFVCPGKHERTQQNTIIDRRGARRCLICQRATAERAGIGGATRKTAN